jgi:hypothetical protein
MFLFAAGRLAISVALARRLSCTSPPESNADRVAVHASLYGFGRLSGKCSRELSRNGVHRGTQERLIKL